MGQGSAESHKKNFSQYIYIAGILLVIAGSFGFFLDLLYFRFVFGVGALFVILNQLIVMFNTRNPDFRQKRLLRMNLMLSLMLALATYSMFDGTTLWIAVVLIYALVTLFMSFRS